MKRSRFLEEQKLRILKKFQSASSPKQSAQQQNQPSPHPRPPDFPIPSPISIFSLQCWMFNVRRPSFQEHGDKLIYSPGLNAKISLLWSFAISKLSFMPAPRLLLPSPDRGDHSASCPPLAAYHVTSRVVHRPKTCRAYFNAI